MMTNKVNKLAVLVAAVAAAVSLLLLSSSSSSSSLDNGDVPAAAMMLKITGEEEGLFELIPVDGGAAGPESLAFDGSGGGPYTGVSDGRVLRWIPGERRWVHHSSSSSTAPELVESCRGSQDPGREHECGRPLGLKFNEETRELYVADAYHGLRVVAPGDNVSRPLLPDDWQGQGSRRPSFSFANGVEVDYQTGAIYFTETSTTFQRREFLNIVISGDKTGRLLRYDPQTKRVEVLADGLAFPNGLAMSSDGTYLLLAETTTGKILRYRIETATLEEVAQLAWFPDNIKWSPRGGFWVGLHAKRGKVAEWCVSRPWLRTLVMSLPMRHVQRASALLNRLGPRQVVAVRVSEQGETVEALSLTGSAVRKAFKSVSEVEERDGTLFIGSVTSPFLGVYRL